MKKEKIKKNLRSYVIIGMFLVFLYVPTLIFPFVKDLLPEDNSENRNLAAFPKVESVSDLTKFPAGFDKYWSDHLPFRGVIQQAYTDANFWLFNSSTHKDAIVGKNCGDRRYTWLFYNSIRDGDPLGDVRGTKRLTDDQLDDILANIRHNTDRMKKRGIDLYYVIAPNKSTIYKEYLPSTVNILNSESMVDQLRGFLDDAGVKNFIFLRNAIEEERRRNGDMGMETPLYYLLDAHWNNYGGFIGAKTLLKAINPKFNAYDEYSVTIDEEVADCEIHCDIKRFMQLGDGVTDVEVNVKTNYDAGYTVLQRTGKRTNDLLEITIGKQPLYKKTVLVVGDSYRAAMLPWLSPVYEKVIYLHRGKYDPEMIDQYKPDVVIVEGVERYAIGTMYMQL